MTLKSFLMKHYDEIDVLTVCDLDGVELNAWDFPENARVVAYTNNAGEFDVMVDPVIPARI